MPAQIAHCLAAEEALLAVAPELARAWGLARVDPKKTEAAAIIPAATWFRFGAQGPDIFYHNQRTMPSGIHYGALAHKRNYGLLLEGALAGLLEAGHGTESPEAAWLLGFATHAALDRAVHPFIVFFSGWQSPLSPETSRFRGCHPFLERLLDLVILGELRGIPIAEVDFEVLLPLELGEWKNEEKAEGDKGEERSDEFAKLFLAAGLRTAYPRATAADFFLGHRIANAFDDARYFFKMTNPARINSGDGSVLAHFDDRSKARSMALLHPESLPSELDLTNSAGAIWQHPAGDGRESRAGFRELFDEGVEGAKSALALTLDSLHDRKIAPGFASSIGNGGLSITDGSGIPVPPRLSRPLPLAELMEREFSKRLEQARGLAARQSRA